MRAIGLCADLSAGKVVVFDKAYADFKHLLSLDQRKVNWVTRAKDNNMAYKVVHSLRPTNTEGIVSDKIIQLVTPKSVAAYPHPLRLVTAQVEINGTLIKMTFITNNLEWVPSYATGLYQPDEALKSSSNRSNKRSS